jgi:hypothetical protein
MWQRRAAVEYAQHLYAEIDPALSPPPAGSINVYSPALPFTMDYLLAGGFQTIIGIKIARHLSRGHKLPGSSPPNDTLYRDARVQTLLAKYLAKYWEVVIPRPSDVLPAPQSLLLINFLKDIYWREKMYQTTANYELLKNIG